MLRRAAAVAAARAPAGPSRMAAAAAAALASSATTRRCLATRAELAAARAAVSSPAAFASRATAVLAAIRGGLDGMLEANPGMSAALHDGGASLVITIPPGAAAGGGSGSLGEKTLKLWVDAARPDGAPALVYDSPKHPQRVYRPSPTGTWRDVVDGHLLAELLARDLIYFAKGYPAFTIDVPTGDGGSSGGGGGAGATGGKPSWPLR